MLDSSVSPPERYATSNYSERLVLVRPSFFVADHVAQLPLPSLLGPSSSRFAEVRRREGLSPMSFLFVNCNQLFKASPALTDVWANILRRTDISGDSGIGSLWLLRHPADAERHIRAELASRGTALSRVIFSNFIERPKFVDRLREVSGPRALHLDNIQYAKK